MTVGANVPCPELPAGLGVRQQHVRRPATEVPSLVAATVESVAVGVLTVSARALGYHPAVSGDPAGVDVQRAGAVLEHVPRDRPGQRLAGHHDRLVRRLQGVAFSVDRRRKCASPFGYLAKFLGQRAFNDH